MLLKIPEMFIISYSIWNMLQLNLTLALVNLLCECSFSINCTLVSCVYPSVFQTHVFFGIAPEMHAHQTHRTTNHLCDGCTVSFGLQPNEILPPFTKKCCFRMSSIVILKYHQK
jgi:hypothetical protein